MSCSSYSGRWALFKSNRFSEAACLLSIADVREGEGGGGGGVPETGG